LLHAFPNRQIVVARRHNQVRPRYRAVFIHFVVRYQRSSPTTGRTLNFTTRYHQQTGLEPTVAAREIYDAVRLLAAAIRITGPNRAMVRDYPAFGATYSGLGGPVSFDKAGNSQGEYVLQVPADLSIRAAF
jgi:ABC-type branched-subunit amino acid transport system substrate-binding protein